MKLNIVIFPFLLLLLLLKDFSIAPANSCELISFTDEFSKNLDVFGFLSSSFFLFLLFRTDSCLLSNFSQSLSFSSILGENVNYLNHPTFIFGNKQSLDGS
jgi:hypothetical protein